MIKLVAFDWNGTILADTNAVMNTQTLILEHYGRKATNLREFQATYSVPIKNYWIAMGLSHKFFDKNYREIQDLFMVNYEPLEKVCRTRAGSREILKWIQDQGMKSVIFSNHPALHIEKQLQRLKIRDRFDQILGRAVEDISLLHTRVKEAKLHKYVKSKKYKTSEVVCVGDTDEEIDIGKKLGYFTVALSGGYQSTRRLKASEPDYLIHNLIELRNVLIR